MADDVSLCKKNGSTTFENFLNIFLLIRTNFGWGNSVKFEHKQVLGQAKAAWLLQAVGMCKVP